MLWEPALKLGNGLSRLYKMLMRYFGLQQGVVYTDTY